MRLDSFIGKRVRLRAIEPGDLDTIYAWENNPVLSPSNNLRAPISKHQLKHFINQNKGAIDPKSSGNLHLIIEKFSHTSNLQVGMVSLYNYDSYHRRVAIGMLISPSYQGKGYAKETVSLMLNYVFRDLRLHQIYAEILSSNQPALILYQSKGFERVATLPEWYWDGEAYEDLHLLQLTKSNYHAEDYI